MSPSTRQLRQGGPWNVTALIVLAAFLCPVPAAGQAAGRRPVRRTSGVTGVELGLEGSLQVVRGGRLRWLLTAYEVLGLRDLRPAPEATITLTTSLDPAEVAGEATTDQHGRAALGLDVPEDAPASFRAVLRVVSRSAVQRRFELTIRTVEPRELTLYAPRPEVRPGGVVRAFGRLSQARTGLPIPQKNVTILLRDAHRRPVGEPVTVATDQAGLYATRFRLPPDLLGQVVVEARVGEAERRMTATRTVSVVEPAAPALLVSVAPASALVSPGQAVPVDVVVRTPLGRPVPETLVVFQGGGRRGQPDPRGQTDLRGRIRFTWHVRPGSSGDRTLTMRASREGVGSATGTARARIARAAFSGALAVEGGALVPPLGGRIWVRVVASSGRPAESGVPVEISGPRIPGDALQAHTDADGVATFEVELGDLPQGVTDRCGGGGATALQVRIGAGPRRAQLSPCVPLEPDGTARVRARPATVTAGGRVAVEVARAPAAARLPVSLAVLLRRGRRLDAVAAQVLPAGQSRLEVDIPPDVTGQVIIRARPLVGREEQDARGGSTSVWVVSGDPYEVTTRMSGAGEGTAMLTFEPGSARRRSAYVVALPVDDARRLADQLGRDALGPLGDLRRGPARAGPALLTAALAAATPRDVGASAVLRSTGRVAVPAPGDPTSLGLLRDPWRARSRFVTGRLALIFRAIEGHVASSIPERIDDVSIRTRRGGWDFNAEIVEAIAASGDLGGEGATGLGGEPLTIEELQSFDRTFSYDAVARRITRERLFRLLLGLRNFVHQNGFDLPWTRLGDPSEWLRSLRGTHVPGGGSLQPRDLVDGWGRPFHLRRARGGRSRFTVVDPLGGWEILSAGPDGRLGNRDDLWDPTARVLSGGSAYAQAVGEDALVARLRGVELGRATVNMLRSSYSGYVRSVPSQPAAASERLARDLWTRLPSVFVPAVEPLGLRRPAHPGDGAAGRSVALPAGSDVSVRLGLDEEPRTWGAVAWVWSHDGVPAVGLGSAPAGSPIIVEAALPSRLRAGEPVDVQLIVTNVTNQQRSLGVTARAEGVLTATAPESIDLAAGTSATATLRLEANAPGSGRLSLSLADRAGALLRSLAFAFRVDSGRQPVRLRAARAISGQRFRTVFTVPDDAARPTGRVVVLGPRGLTADPDLADLRRRDPALVAWAEALAGRPMSAAQRAALLRAQAPGGQVQGTSAPLSTACGIIALSAAGVEDEEAMQALRRAQGVLSGPQPMEDPDPEAGAYRAASAVLAALAAGGVAEVADAREQARDPVARFAAQLRPVLRRAIHALPEEPSVLARASAALLLADPRDAHGLAMLERAERRLVAAPEGGTLVAPSVGRAGRAEALTATFALAVAAHQAGQDDLARRLLRGALPHGHLLARLGGEGAFWLLASAAYGAMGTGEPEQIVVSDGRQRHNVTLVDGRAVVPLAELSPGQRRAVRIESTGGPLVLARAEMVMGRTFSRRADGPLRLEIHGDAGGADEVAALELSVRAAREVRAPVIDLQLPAGVEADERLLASLRSATGVRDAAGRDPGFLRIWLHDMDEGTEVAVPLPFRWTARGELTGLGAAAYPIAYPEAMTVIEPRAVVVR